MAYIKNWPLPAQDALGGEVAKVGSSNVSGDRQRDCSIPPTQENPLSQARTGLGKATRTRTYPLQCTRQRAVSGSCGYACSRFGSASTTRQKLCTKGRQTAAVWRKGFRIGRLRDLEHSCERRKDLKYYGLSRSQAEPHRDSGVMSASSSAKRSCGKSAVRAACDKLRKLWFTSVCVNGYQQISVYRHRRPSCGGCGAALRRRC